MKRQTRQLVAVGRSLRQVLE